MYRHCERPFDREIITMSRRGNLTGLPEREVRRGLYTNFARHRSILTSPGTIRVHIDTTPLCGRRRSPVSFDGCCNFGKTAVPITRLLACRQKGTGNPSLGITVQCRGFVYGEWQLLLAAEIMFRRLDRHVAKQELDLVELAAGQMAETRTCPTRMPNRLRCTLITRTFGCGYIRHSAALIFRSHLVTETLT
jgi:hypothetical protein